MSQMYIQTVVIVIQYQLSFATNVQPLG